MTPSILDEPSFGVDPDEIDDALRQIRAGDAEPLAQLLGAVGHPFAPQLPRFLRGSSVDGYVLGNYRFARWIGRGGMGHVFEAVSQASSLRSALKVSLRGPGSIEWDAVAVETEILMHCQGSDVVELHDYGEASIDGDRIRWLAMEYVDGVSWKSHMVACRENIAARLSLLLLLCRATASIHSRGVVHRDLKPGNVLLTSAGIPRIIDYGLSQLSTTAGTYRIAVKPGAVLGTLPYMSPELLLSNDSSVGPWSDVFSLGVMMLEAILCNRPYSTSNLAPADIARLVATHVGAACEKVSASVSESLAQVVRRATEYDHRLRFRDAGELTRALENALR